MIGIFILSNFITSVLVSLPALSADRQAAGRLHVATQEENTPLSGAFFVFLIPRLAPKKGIILLTELLGFAKVNY